MSRERMVALADHLQSSAPPTERGPARDVLCVRARPRTAPIRCSDAAAAAPQPDPSATSVEGRPILARVCGTREDRAILFLGGIHGNEPAGVTLCEALWDYLARASLGETHRKVIVAAALNPDGLVRNTRENVRGVDLNRNFDTSNRDETAPEHGSAAFSEPEAQFVAHLIEHFSPVAIVSVHQPLACVDYDGPAEALAAAMSRECGLPIEKLVNSRPYPGSLGTYLL